MHGSQEPANLVHIGERKRDDPKITIIEYDDVAYAVREITAAQIAECRTFPDRDTVAWINVDGAHEASTIEALGQHFKLHPLVVEDILNPAQRPKLEEYDDCLFIVMKMIYVDPELKAQPGHAPDEERLVVEQMSMVMGKNFVITFQERVGDVFDDVRARIKNATGRIRKQKADYLAYRLIDAIVDNYFTALDAMSDLIESVETHMTEDPTRVDARELHTLKRESLFLRRAVVPARELVATLAKTEDVEFIHPSTVVYLRDLYDHLVQVTETLEVQRGILASMTDVYHASISNKMNEIMKVMTIVSTIFIPLSFIAGVYGMNFEFMPELHEKLGYPAVLALMFFSAGGMLVYFRRKKWF